jgi:alkyl sulfatase BDS1-like metallo-beta-lactamase superfamily hydrolase
MTEARRVSPFLNPKRILIGLLALAVISASVLFLSKDARRATELRLAETAGSLATRVVASRAEGGAAADFISIPVEVRKLDGDIFQARGVANTQVIATSAGHVVFDTGLATQAAKQRRLLDEALPPGAITHIILSHSHQDHVGGTRFWVEDETEIITHRGFSEEQRYLLDLQDYLWSRNRTLFPFMPENPIKFGPFAYGGIEPTLVVDDFEPLRFEQGGVRFEVLSTPGAEGLDNLCLWLPDRKILFSGDTFGPNFPQFPNVFTMRGEKVRKPIEYIASLERLIALEPEMIIPSHQDPIRGREKIRADLIKMRDAVRYVHDATIAGMNAGQTVHELMAEIELPDSLALSQTHGRVSWAVKSIWEYYATWFHFDSTTELYAVPAEAVRPELARLAGIDAIAKLAAEHVEANEYLEALHLLEVALAGDPSHPGALDIRLSALQNLLTQAETGFRNSYEMDWLKYRIRATKESLAAAVQKSDLRAAADQ